MYPYVNGFPEIYIDKFLTMVRGVRIRGGGSRWGWFRSGRRYRWKAGQGERGAVGRDRVRLSGLFRVGVVPSGAVGAICQFSAVGILADLIRGGLCCAGSERFGSGRVALVLVPGWLFLCLVLVLVRVGVVEIKSDFVGLRKKKSGRKRRE